MTNNTNRNQRASDDTPASSSVPAVSVPPRPNPSDQSVTPGTDGAEPSEPPTSSVGSSPNAPTDSSTANACLELIKGFENGTRSKVRTWIGIQDTINNAFRDNGGRLSNPGFGQTKCRRTKCPTEEPNQSIRETKSSVDQLWKWYRVWR
ncbi:hypothetical protein K435DRAFT_840883 [Dendrothele bispora CBS 962.96]|uniref:Uncharacterized protein n=1 Tax=Dendrothele bispora (strain CBS 962.96) TaxID=1314807 RepID=A0A4S8LQT5_DENBC|nr:hypothetical protein K435DRAFT_840883 [Dendrothele bispora CBS 962.96]